MGGTFSQQPIWQAKPQTSQTTPCLVSPTISEVQWLHLVGDEKVRTKNWCDLKWESLMGTEGLERIEDMLPTGIFSIAESHGDPGS
jgi:hypothetical protein